MYTFRGLTLVRLSCILLVVSSRAGSQDSAALLNAIRDKVIADSERAPKYTCVETVTRQKYRPKYDDRPGRCPALMEARDKLTSAGKLIWHDRLRLDVAVGENSEIFSWAGAKRFETSDPGELVSAGASGSGDFGSLILNIFRGETGQFRYAGEKDSPLGRLATFGYSIPLEKSRYLYRVGTMERVIGYHGDFHALSSTAEVRRLTIDANDFPEGEVCRLGLSMDYSSVKIGDSRFTVPETTRMTVLYRDGDEAQNETRYSKCREYLGESTLRFDDAVETAEQSASAARKLPELPPNTHLRLIVNPLVDPETAAAGDPITAVLERDVKDKDRILARAGDRLHGRLLRLEQFLIPSPRWIVAMRFDSLVRDGVEQPISLQPLDDGERGRVNARTNVPRTLIVHTEVRPAGTGVFIFYQSGKVLLDKNFHSEWTTR